MKRIGILGSVVFVASGCMHVNFSESQSGTDVYFNARNPYPGHGSAYTNYSHHPRADDRYLAEGSPSPGHITAYTNFSNKPRAHREPSANDLRLACGPTLPANAPTLATLSGDRIVLGQRVVFKPWRAELDDQSLPLMDAVANILRSNAHVERVEIQGHTARMGMPEKMRELSLSRSRTVAEHLIKLGVEPGRLLTKGYGESRPLSDTHQDADRRVEFVVLDTPTSTITFATDERHLPSEN